MNADREEFLLWGKREGDFRKFGRKGLVMKKQFALAVVACLNLVGSVWGAEKPWQRISDPTTAELLAGFKPLFFLVFSKSAKSAKVFGSSPFFSWRSSSCGSDHG